MKDSVSWKKNKHLSSPYNFFAASDYFARDSRTLLNSGALGM